MLARGAEIPFLSGRVNDNAGILSLETSQKLTQRLKDHEDSTSNQVVVLTISSLEGEELEAYSIRVVEAWKLGQKELDNGVLLLVSHADRKVRIEVGRGLEGDLPDITCGTIIRKEIIPRFKEGNYDAGVTAGVEAILRAIQGSYTAPEDEPGLAEEIVGRILAGSIFLIVVGIFTIMGLLIKGGQAWFLYIFLIPFWLAFPMAILGEIPGGLAFGLYLVGFPFLKVWFAHSEKGRRFFTSVTSNSILSGITSGRGSSGSGGRSGSSGGGFSGGGGGFSGGGASGSW
jgi:uncharacterized protein